MADIVSRIRVEAQGADQAAREIRKLKEAYDQVAQSAKGLSANVGSGSGDPFSRATASGGGSVGAGHDPSDISYRESRTRHEKDLQYRREQAHQNYSGIRPQTVQAGFSTAEAISSGRTGSAIGTALGAVGGMLGPVGLSLGAAAAAFTGVQRLADNAYDRFGQFRHSGMSQRLGVDALDAVRESTQLERSGIPTEMVSSFFSSASHSGVNLQSGNAKDSARIGMVAAAALGIDPSAVAGLMGSLERSGIDSGSALGAGGGMYAVAENVFGRADAGIFIQGIQSLLEDRTGRGIRVGDGSVHHSAGMIAALSGTGMTSQAAVSFAQQLQGRGIQATGLQRPEDIIAFQSMREDGMSVTDTLRAMEESPHEVNRRVLERLRTMYGGDNDLLQFHVKEYLGEGASWSNVDRFIRTGGVPSDIGALGFGDDIEEKALADESYSRSQAIDASRNRQLLSEVSIKALETLANLGNALLKTDLSVGRGRMFGSSRGLPSGEEIDERINTVNDMTIQDVGNLSISVKELGEDANVGRVLNFLDDPRAASAYSSMQAMRADPKLAAYIGNLYSKISGGSERFSEIEGALNDPVLESRIGTAGNWAAIGSTIQSGIISDLDSLSSSRSGLFRTLDNPEANSALNRVRSDVYNTLLSGHEDINLETLINLISDFKDIIAREGFVHTDGVWSYQGVQ